MTNHKVIMEWAAREDDGKPIVYWLCEWDVYGEKQYGLHVVGDDKWLAHGEAFKPLVARVLGMRDLIENTLTLRLHDKCVDELFKEWLGIDNPLHDSGDLTESDRSTDG